MIEKRVAKWFCIFLWIVGNSCYGSAPADPLALLQSVTQEVLAELKAEQETIKADPRKVQALINRVMLPQVDIDGMSQWVVGRTAWNQASSEQQQAFIGQFRHLILNTYANTLSAYHNQTIEYFPMREPVADKVRVQVISVIREPSKEPINVVYRLVKKPEGWKVYDIIIEGISLLKGFQAQFAEDIQSKGLTKVTEDLRVHNQKVDASNVEG
jgi:phospholipid transport system substrate-binding protein